MVVYFEATEVLTCLPTVHYGYLVANTNDRLGVDCPKCSGGFFTSYAYEQVGISAPCEHHAVFQSVRECDSCPDRFIVQSSGEGHILIVVASAGTCTEYAAQAP